MSFDEAKAVAQRSATGWIVTWALCDSVAVLGLTASFLSMRPLLHFWPFAAVSLALFVLYRPRAAWIEDVLRAQRESNAL